ncbi:unnamed protein product [Arabis nemorensis]|uniref:Cyclin-dependent kinase inhibitor domain-containing protein n=1 Tax=Arabis nemorensis TaxID=586526 RepID=A0A565C8F4_9BRAS|nr:unnamed protein product [Arabis nemorensis]
MVRKCRKPKGLTGKDGIGASSTYMQLRSRRIVYFTTVDDCRSENPSSVADNGASSSCEYSTTITSRRNVLVDEFIDLEEERDGDTETSTYQQRSTTKRKLFQNFRDKSMENPSSEMKESSDCCCSGRIRTSEEMVKSTTEQPTETEIEDFFAEAEKQLQTKFTKKYNFDFEKEKPLEGRYEWVKLSE